MRLQVALLVGMTPSHSKPLLFGAPVGVSLDPAGMERSSFVEGVLDWQVLLGATSSSSQATHNPSICLLDNDYFFIVISNTLFTADVTDACNAPLLIRCL